jgi:hypothetical protein
MLGLHQRHPALDFVLEAATLARVAHCAVTCYWTVTLTLVECAVAPAVATIVTEDVIGVGAGAGTGVGVPPPDDGGAADAPDCDDTSCDPPPPPHACKASPATSRRHRITTLGFILLRRPNSKMIPANGSRSAYATAKLFTKGCRVVTTLALDAAVESVRVARAAVAPGVTAFGEKLQVIP